jgi:tol-pal system protein YbgF
MRSISLIAIASLLLPAGLFAASKEQQEMQRDIAQLQDQVRTLQSTVDQKLAAIQTLTQQALDAANKANTTAAVLSNSVSQTLDRELTSRMTPVTGLAAKVDGINNDVSEVRNSVSDLNSQMNKVLAAVNDINVALKAMQAPAPPPPGASGGASTPPPQPGVLFTNAVRDQNGGKFDLAISEFSDFLKFYPDDPNAASAQLNIGQCHFQQGKYELAAQDFDAVIERYPESQVTPEAYLQKGQALKAGGKKADAIATFRSLVTKFPREEQTTRAKEELRLLGVSVPNAPAAPVRKKPALPPPGR